jgi:hypothetical protein
MTRLGTTPWSLASWRLYVSLRIFVDEEDLHGLKQFGALLILFVLWEWYMGKYAMMPLHMFKNRTQAGASLEIFFIFFCFLLAVGIQVPLALIPMVDPHFTGHLPSLPISSERLQRCGVWD